MEATFEPITKDQFEYWVDESSLTKLSEAQWKKVVDELQGRVNNFIDNLLYDVVLDFREGVYDE